jgi:hypothetical protein
MLITLDLNWLIWPGQIAQAGLPDLTQPQSIDLLVNQLPMFLALAIGLTAVMALFNFSLRNYPADHVAVGNWMMRSTQFIRGLQQILLITLLLLAGFGLCSTLANSQSNWEQAQISKKTPVIADEFVQQSSPQVSYTSQEPYVYTTQLGGKLVKVEDKKEVTRQLAVSGSNILVSIAPAPTKSSDGNNYLIDFNGDYQISNSIPAPSGFATNAIDRFVFQLTPPTGSLLLQNFGFEQDGKKLARANPGDYRFPVQVAPGKVSKIHVTYRAQGSPQWVYSAKDGSLSNFRLAISSKMPGLNFINGIAPTRVSRNGDRQVFSWTFNRNASAQKPFGVAVAPPTAPLTGKLPLLLLLAPGILLWWLLLLCFSLPMGLQQISITGLVFFANMFALTYFSRLADPIYLWSGISVVLILLVWGLGRNNWRVSLAAVICTILGLIFPVYGFLVGARGVMLSIAALLSVIWLAARNWHGWYQLAPSVDSSYNPPHRQEILEESATYNQLNPAALTAEEIAQRLREEGSRSD